jgi:hypothetical protein
MTPKKRSTLKKQVAVLEAQIRDLQAFCGVLAPMFEKEYRKQKDKWKRRRLLKRVTAGGDRRPHPDATEGPRNEE